MSTQFYFQHINYLDFKWNCYALVSSDTLYWSCLSSGYNLCLVQCEKKNTVVILVAQKVQFSPPSQFHRCLGSKLYFFYYCWSAIKRPTFYPGETALFLLSLEVLLNIFHGKGLPGGGNKSQSIAFIAAQHTSHRDTCTSTIFFLTAANTGEATLALSPEVACCED